MERFALAPVGLGRSDPSSFVGVPSTARIREMPKVVLVVDDEPLIFDLTVEILKDLGCEVRSAENGAGTLGRLEEDPRIDLLMTDVQMPRMSGYELAEKAKRRWPDLRIIVMSGNDLGGKGYAVVRKPFSHAQLQRVIHNALG